jgi:hypothetical protein
MAASSCTQLNKPATQLKLFCRNTIRRVAQISQKTSAAFPISSPHFAQEIGKVLME